jgi:ABC-2 type transport system ATP-binding protein
VEISVAGLGFSYRGATWALDVEELRLGPGVTGLAGINGAGKSTLMRCLAGAQRPARGAVVVDGTDLYAGRVRNAVLSRIGLMPQEFALPRDASVLDTVAYVGWVRGLPLRRARAAAAVALARVGLGETSSREVRRLSGGMLRRLCLAQALVVEPDVLLLDEPTTGLDPEQRAHLRTLVAATAGEGGTTLISSHVMEDLEALADRIVVLHDGRVLHHGPLEEFRTTYGGRERSAERAFLTVLAGARSAC